MSLLSAALFSLTVAWAPAPETSDDGPVAAPADHPPRELLVPATPKPLGWSVGAFADLSYGFNSNRPDNHIFRGQLTTPRTGEFTLNTAAVYVQHPVTQTEPWGFELALQAGSAVDAIYEAEPVPGGDDGRFAGAEVFKHVGRANASLLVRKSKTTITGGLMSAPIGIGGAWTKDNWNYSTSWGANAAPYYLMGGVVEQALPADFAVQAWIINGWQTIADVNEAPSGMVSLLRRRGPWHLVSQAYFGPEATDLQPRGWRVLWDNQAIFDGSRWGVGAVGQLGRDRLTELAGEPVHLWLYGAVFVHGVMVERDHFELDLAARPELTWDRDGLVTGAPQILHGETVTLGARIWEHLLVRLEYRYDRSTAPNGYFFRGAATGPNDALASEQHTIFGSVVGTFEHVFGLRTRQRAG